MRNVGIIFDNNIPSQTYAAFMNSALTLTTAKPNQYNFSLFFNDFVPDFANAPLPRFSAFQLSTFTGTLIATSLETAKTCINTIGPAKVILYVSDLEWLWGKNDFIANIAIFQNVEVVCQSESHKKALENYYNKKVRAVPNYDIERIIYERTDGKNSKPLRRRKKKHLRNRRKISNVREQSTENSDSGGNNDAVEV